MDTPSEICLAHKDFSPCPPPGPQSQISPRWLKALSNCILITEVSTALTALLGICKRVDSLFAFSVSYPKCILITWQFMQLCFCFTERWSGLLSSGPFEPHREHAQVSPSSRAWNPCAPLNCWTPSNTLSPCGKQNLGWVEYKYTNRGLWLTAKKFGEWHKKWGVLGCWLLSTEDTWGSGDASGLSLNFLHLFGSLDRSSRRENSSHDPLSPGKLFKQGRWNHRRAWKSFPCPDGLCLVFWQDPLETNCITWEALSITR